jgi:hypothetical protein
MSLQGRRIVGEQQDVGPERSSRLLPSIRCRTRGVHPDALRHQSGPFAQGRRGVAIPDHAEFYRRLDACRRDGAQGTPQ